MVWCIFWVWNVAMKKMYEKELWNLLRTNASLFYFDAPSTKITTPLGGKSKWTPEFTPLNKLLYMKKTLALQSINNELNSELSYQYKDSNRINTLICTLLKIFSSKTYSNCESLTERKSNRFEENVQNHRRTGRGGEGCCSPPKFWETQIFWVARENLGKACF